MATLTLTIGLLTSERTAADVNAQRVLESAFALFHEEPDTYSNQEKLDYIVQVLVPLLLIDKARQYEEREAVLDAQAGVNDDPPIFD